MKRISPTLAIILVLLAMTVFGIGAFYILKGAYSILSFIAPALLLLAAVIDYKVIIGYVQSVIQLLRQNPLMGIVMALGTFFLFPLVALYLVGRAWLGKRVREMINERTPEEQKVEDVDYEDITEDVETLDIETLELPDQETISQGRNKYTDLMD